ncbi:fluoride efflux transporter CrcB [Candidatus Solirubrobacter pratensis]|uniref:fluoride efflux transporter CrcB n=1 Tax=Candidatus Solirubrobacter pratensis TaxID=1298857 RepID=UPI0012DEF7B1|nr:fluoride efflux transporter CrcB [Candidatus Solirubrobacter pratensis]
MLAWIGVALLGAAGACARFYVGGAVSARRPSAFPLGTFVVNLSGGFLLGLLTGLSVTGHVLLVLGTGLLGAYTTFSTWMVEAQRLGEDGAFPTAWLYLLGSMGAGLAMTYGGWVCGEALG